MKAVISSHCRREWTGNDTSVSVGPILLLRCLSLCACLGLFRVRPSCLPDVLSPQTKQDSHAGKKYNKGAEVRSPLTLRRPRPLPPLTFFLLRFLSLSHSLSVLLFVFFTRFSYSPTFLNGFYFCLGLALPFLVFLIFLFRCAIFSRFLHTTASSSGVCSA